MTVEFIKNQKDYADKYWVHRNTAKSHIEKKLQTWELKEVPKWVKYYIVDRDAVIQDYLKQD